MRFMKLEELRLCGWVEEQPVEVKKKVVRPAANVKKVAKPTGGPSRLREMIAGEEMEYYYMQLLIERSKICRLFSLC